MQKPTVVLPCLHCTVGEQGRFKLCDACRGYVVEHRALPTNDVLLARPDVASKVAGEHLLIARRKAVKRIAEMDDDPRTHGRHEGRPRGRL